jgi:hypothetical protein
MFWDCARESNWNGEFGKVLAGATGLSGRGGRYWKLSSDLAISTADMVARKIAHIILLSASILETRQCIYVCRVQSRITINIPQPKVSRVPLPHNTWRNQHRIRHAPENYRTSSKLALRDACSYLATYIPSRRLGVALRMLSTRRIISAASEALTTTCFFNLKDSVIPNSFIEAI